MGCETCLNKNEEKEIFALNSEENNNSLFKETIISENKETKEEKNHRRLNTSSKKYIQEKAEEFNLEILSEINKYRLNHRVDELIYDEKISKISQKYAEKCAREKELELSENKYNNDDLGEILFCCKEELTPKEIVEIWYNSGSENYDYNKEPEISNNFTQLIWKSTKLFGLGHALTKENEMYIVANFFPEGNIKGEFLKNIFPLISISKSSSIYSINTKFLEDILNSHNEIRAKHKSPPLILNPSLSTLAQKDIEKMIEVKEIKKKTNKRLGINLFTSKNNCSGEEVTSFWYKGKDRYNFENNDKINYKDEIMNNFTQLIWKNTKEVGFGFTNDEEGNFYVLAYYFPKGNIKGQYKNNVLPDYLKL